MVRGSVFPLRQQGPDPGQVVRTRGGLLTSTSRPGTVMGRMHPSNLLQVLYGSLKIFMSQLLFTFIQ